MGLGLIDFVSHGDWSAAMPRVRRARACSAVSLADPAFTEGLARVNEALTEKELIALRRSAQSGSPFGDSTRIESTAQRLGLVSTINALGRPQVHVKHHTDDKES